MHNYNGSEVIMKAGKSSMCPGNELAFQIMNLRNYHVDIVFSSFLFASTQNISMERAET